MPRVGLFLFIVVAVDLIAAVAALAAPTVSVTVGEVTSSTASISWVVTQDTCFQSYEVYYREVKEPTWQPGSAFLYDAGTTSFTLTRLSPSTAYAVFVREYDCNGSQDSAAQNFTTRAIGTNAGPPAPLTIPPVAIVGGLVSGITVLVVVFAFRNAAAKAARSPPPPSPTPPASETWIPVELPAGPAPKKCANCGTRASGPICGKCGARVLR